MTDQTSAPAVDHTTAPAEYTPHDLGNLFAEARSTEIPAESAEEPATAEPELAQANAAPERDPGEVTTEAEPAEEPPIEPPRSWTQAEKERFQSLPRETQEYLHTREQEREREFRRSQNEIAEERKAIKAEREAAVQERKTLAAKLPELRSAVEEYLSHKYPEFKTMDDVYAMARQADELAETDPFTALKLGNRVQAWEKDQQRIALQMSAAQGAQATEARERELSLLKYQADETAKLSEFVPEVKDPEKLRDLTTKAVGHLKAFDFTDQHLNEYAAQGDKPFIFSAGFQRILLNSMKYEEIQKAKITAAAKPVPPVQRPGAAKPQGAAQSETFTKLSAQLERSGDPRDLGALIGHLRRA